MAGGKGTKTQPAHPELARRLRQILREPHERVLVGILPLYRRPSVCRSLAGAGGHHPPLRYAGMGGEVSGEPCRLWLRQRQPDVQLGAGRPGRVAAQGRPALERS